MEILFVTLKIMDVITVLILLNLSEHVTILMVDDGVKTDYIHTTVMVNDVTLDMILDTGSKVTLIDFDTYKTNFSDCKLYPSDTNLSTFDKRLIDNKGYFIANVVHEKHCVRGKVYDTKHGRCVLGLKWMQALNIRLTPESINYTLITSDSEHIFSKFPELFNGSISKVKGFQHKCHVLPEAVPVVQKQRPIPFALQSQVQEEIDKLLDSDIIEKVEHSY